MVTENRIKRIEKNMASLRGARDRHRTKIQNHTNQITRMFGLIDAMAREIEDLKKRMDSVAVKPGPSGELPERIENAKDLVKFIENHPDLGAEWGTEHVATKKLQCSVVRDLLPGNYSNIERVNDQKEHHDYSAPDDKHQDAVVLVVDSENRKLDQIYDICIGSSDRGSILSLDGNHDACWRLEETYPRGWKNKE